MLDACTTHIQIPQVYVHEFGANMKGLDLKRHTEGVRRWQLCCFIELGQFSQVGPLIDEELLDILQEGVGCSFTSSHSFLPTLRQSFL